MTARRSPSDYSYRMSRPMRKFTVTIHAEIQAEDAQDALLQATQAITPETSAWFCAVAPGTWTHESEIGKRLS